MEEKKDILDCDVGNATEKEAEQENASEDVSIEIEQEGDPTTEGEKEAEAEEQELGKKGLFKKKEKKDKKTEQIEELTDRFMRTIAEFDNYRKRTDKEKSQMYEIGAREVLEKILPVIDNFERGFAGLSVDEMKEPFVEGMDRIFKQLMVVVEEVGVKPIEAVGQPFDPNFHNAVMHVEDEKLEENIVVEEFQKGYLYKETVMRHSMVKVAN